MDTAAQPFDRAGSRRGGGTSNPRSVYERIREDIIVGDLAADERLNIAAMAARYKTSTNPVREALQQLRGEGFVLFRPNRGARVRPIDEDFLRDIYEIETLIEPYMTRWFVGIVSDGDIAQLEAIQREIETLNFSNSAAHSVLDTRFHRVVYDRHYNRQAVDTWLKHREILWAITGRFEVSRARRAAVLREHRQLIDCLKAGDANAAARVIGEHVEGSAQHTIGHMRAGRSR